MAHAKSMEKWHNSTTFMSPYPAMKTPYPHLLLAAVLTATSVFAADAEKKASNVTVNFQDSEKFTDARSSLGGGTDDGYLKILSEHLQKTAAKHLAAGQKL